MGRPVSQAPGEVTRGFQERATWLLASPPDALADEPQAPKEGFERFIRHEPLGVVLVVAPWNYPYLMLGQLGAAGPARRQRRGAQVGVADPAGLRAVGRGARRGGPARWRVPVRPRRPRRRSPGWSADPRVGFVAFTGSVEGGHAMSAPRPRRASSAPASSSAARTPPTCGPTPRRGHRRRARRRRVLQQRPVVLRRRAHLRAPRPLRRVRRRVRLELVRGLPAGRPARAGHEPGPDGPHQRGATSSATRSPRPWPPARPPSSTRRASRPTTAGTARTWRPRCSSGSTTACG